MCTSEAKVESALSWRCFYKIVSYILSSGQLNYISGVFCNTGWKKILMVTMFMFNVSINIFCQCGNILPNNYDQEDKIMCLIILFIGAQIVLKLLTLVYHNVLLTKLTDEILSKTSSALLETWEFKLAQKYYKVVRLICVSAVLLYCSVMVGFILLPMFSSKHYMMPILIDFPGSRFLIKLILYGLLVNLHSSYLGRYKYAFNYFVGSYSVFYGTFLQMGFDIPAFLQVSFIGLQLERCIHYCNIIGDFESEYNTDERQSALLNKCIQMHKYTFEFIDQVARINSYVIALVLATGIPILIISLYSMLLGTVSASPIVMLAATYNFFVYCYLGEIVTNKCEEASTAIYTSQWYRIRNVNEKRKFLVFLTISQRRMHFSAGGLFSLSLENFTESMKRVYGAYAFLKEVL